ncbi:ATP-dependent helicase [Prescottella equi]|uniref:ATP-dependent helicase n=1 Tax=Rhodococcus hoagii TaxID=43767 RepID=UPI00119D35CF|nr:ATP-dependent DNA helicase [Prescottella equi]MBM4526921.1 UvrD-helicase domain-containing protein [Prescottella equi]MBM4599928.1 UvrD-helicase domain-containing protein [Prescottella equi]MBM4652694.1 UvrD-helicase domain-containing protein [Prescottella equi]MBM4686029.1 UvrD-helicase domain-containing protein [Prescottella equi]WJJ13144.1 ATP-dependent DNA helicase [Prescottella equi]
MSETGARTRQTAPTARLVGRRGSTPSLRTWSADPARVLTGAPPGRGWHPWQILGGPGTGKTTLLVDAAVARIVAGEDPESVLVLTQSRRAATAIREQITERLLAAEHDPESPGVQPRATREPLVRTVHSYAFAVLRLQAAAHGNPPPRLITGAEQDAVLRELLRGDIADGGGMWPERLRPALGMTGFAVELRNLMLRANERGLGPEDLIDLGYAHDKAEWVAAGRFAAHYEQGMLLRGAVGMEAPEATAPALDAAELISAALTAFATDRDLLRRERARVRHLLVDDAQHLDPQAAQLVRLIGTGTASTAIAGDPDQAIFAFRGADPRFLTGLADRGDPAQVILDTNFRAAPAVARVAGRIAGLLPGNPPHRGAAVPVTEDDTDGRAVVRVLSTPAKEAALVADTLRRAHLIDGVPWSEMAIVARSVPRVLPPLRRALLSAGVPVTTAASELPLAKQHGVAGLLSVMRALVGGEFTGEDAIALLSGPIGGAEPVSLRRLRRGLRRVELASGGDRDSAELLRALLVDGPDADGVAHLLPGLTDVESLSLRRVLKVLRRARVPLQRGRGIEEVLWAAWQATGLERRWAAASAFGGPIGAQADRDLDAVVALFDAAANYVDRLPRAQLSGFVDYLVEQAIPGPAPMRAVASQETVTVLSAHSAAGRQWRVVVVLGVQEGLWPSLGARGTLLGTEELIEITSGLGEVDKTLSRTAPLLAEERRLFLVACSRARDSLLVTAVDSSSGDTELVRSRFVDDLLRGADDLDVDEVAPVTDDTPRVLALPALVAELRSVVCDPDVAVADPERQQRAAHQLARLAEAGVRGAHPDQWYGTSAPSSDVGLWDPEDGPVPLSPSTIELIANCPLRWMLERHGGSDGDNTHAIAGTLVHTLVQALAGHIPPDQVDHALETAWDSVDLGSEWFSRRELERTRGMLDNFADWLRGTRSELTEIGVEVAVDGVLEPRTEGEATVRIRGRIDRLERDSDGRPVVIDVKTAKAAVTKEQAEQHAQLAAYQVAAARGLIDGVPASQPGGARLVFVAKPHKKEGSTQRIQSALDDDGVALWENVIHDAAAATRGPTFLARINDGCRHCPVLSSCPAHDEGRQVTSE